MVANNHLEQSRRMTQFFSTLARETDRPKALAFGVKLLDIMPLHDIKVASIVVWNLKPQIEEARRRFTSDYAVSPEMSDIMMKNFGDSMKTLANELEKARRAREANALRMIHYICEAYAYPNNPSLAMMCLGKAAVKAIYAGADVSKIKTAAALLFG